MRTGRKNILYGILMLTVLLCAVQWGRSQSIPPQYYGQNAWMPYQIGSRVLNGQLEQKWGEINESGAKLVRYGGISVDKDKPTKDQYLEMVNSIRANGMEPILQIPFNNYQHSAAYAADIVRHINIEQGKNVKYWVVGNEPHHVFGYSHPSQIAKYIKEYSTAMKAVDPNIKIIGPEVAWYNSYLLDGLLTPGGPDDITGKGPNGYYVDIVTFHTYPFGGAQSRQEVIDYLDGSYRSNIRSLKSKASNCSSYHGRSGSSAIKIAITEANINYKNNAADNLYGNGAMSFIGGQFWAEMLAIGIEEGLEFLTFWSVVEGNNTELNIGYIDKFAGKKQPTYHHFKLMANNFNGTWCKGSDNIKNVKAFGSKNGQQVVVMIMNQELTTNHKYTVRLNNDAISSSNSLKVNINAGLAKEYSGEISSQSTVMLKFDASGNIKEITEYKLNGHASADLPPTVTPVSPQTPSEGITATITMNGSSFCDKNGITLQANQNAEYGYQWIKDSNPISGATSSSYKVTSAGSYQVRISHGTNIATSDPVKVANGQVTATITPKDEATIKPGDSLLLSANNGEGYTYQWYRNDQVLTDETGSKLLVKEAGDFKVEIKNGACKGTSNPVKVTLDGPLSSENGEEEPEVEPVGIFAVKLFPVPANGPCNLDISTENTEQVEVSVEVINSAGQLVHHEKIMVEKGRCREKLNEFSQWAAGTYIVRVIEEDNESVTKIIVF